MRVSVICILLVIVLLGCVSKPQEQQGPRAIEAQTENSCNQILKMFDDFRLDPESFIRGLCIDTCTNYSLNYTNKWECSEKDRLLCYCDATPFKNITDFS